VGAVLVTVAGERLQRWLYSRGWLSKQRKRIERMYERYGILGVAFQAPMLTGAPLGTSEPQGGFGAPATRLLFWMCLSLVLWGTVLTGAVVLGFSISGV
jgi:hypothetical protein